MSADFSIRPVGTSVVTPAVVPQTHAAAKTAVPTQLPSDKAVTAAPQTETQSQTPSATSALDYGHQVVLDSNANTLVYQTVNNRTSYVVEQYPEEAQLRARAYYKAQDEAKQAKQLETTNFVA